MPESTHDGPVQRPLAPKRYASEGPDETSALNAWIAAAVDATTLGELYEIVRTAQSAGAWDERDGAWCRALRAALGVNDRVALALLRRDLGGVEVAS